MMVPLPHSLAIGLEVHVQLATGRKLLCGCRHRYGAPPNSDVCPICLGFPGTLPVLDSAAAPMAARLALALDAEVRPTSRFDRKSYFYPDLPKGFQVTQQREPLAEGGRLSLESGPTVPLRRLHIEEDSGKRMEAASGQGASGACDSWVDFNRAGAPLVEVVTEPVLTSPEEAEEFLRLFHRLLLALRITGGKLEEGALRCDANVSLSGGPRVEIKNLNSFRHLRWSLEAEIERQGEALSRGDAVQSETRGFDAERRETFSQRSKEAREDYRFLPEPDLPPILLDAVTLERLRATLPELPGERQQRFVTQFGLPREEAELLARRPEVASYLEVAAAAAEDAARQPADFEGRRPPSAPSASGGKTRRRTGDDRGGSSGDSRDPAGRAAKVAAHLVRTELLPALSGEAAGSPEAPLANAVGLLAARVATGRVGHAAARQVLEEMRRRGGHPDELIERLDLERVVDRARLERWVRQALAEAPELAERLRGGDHRLLGPLLGQAIRLSGGKADPGRTREALLAALQRPEKTAAGAKPSTSDPRTTPETPPPLSSPGTPPGAGTSNRRPEASWPDDPAADPEPEAP